MHVKNAQAHLRARHSWLHMGPANCTWAQSLAGCAAEQYRCSSNNGDAHGASTRYTSAYTRAYQEQRSRVTRTTSHQRTHCPVCTQLYLTCSPSILSRYADRCAKTCTAGSPNGSTISSFSSHSSMRWMVAWAAAQTNCCQHALVSACPYRFCICRVPVLATL